MRSLGLVLEPDALRASVAARVRELVGCESVTLCTPVGQGEPFVGRHSSPVGEGDVLPSFSPDGSLAKWMRVNEQPFLLPHPSGALHYLDDSEQRQLLGLHARACVPVTAVSQLVGILVISSRDPRWNLSVDDVAYVVQLADEAGLALQNAEFRSLERERLRNVYRAEQLAVAGQLAATIAHEIRNPMAAIRSTVQYTLSSESDWNTKRRLLEGIIEAVDRIDQTIGGVLALTRSNDVGFGDVDLIGVVEEALVLTEAYARAHGTVVDRMFEVVSLPVTGDRRGLQQVCVNLFMNACQSMPDGGRATFRCSVSEGPPLSAQLQIRDTGQGIADEHLSKIFDPFFTTKDGGTGLGLPICVDIITRHGGRLRLDNEPGGGATATVLLPLRTI